MIAILAQFKDPQGTIFVMKPPDSKKGNTMEVVYKIETLVQSFTTFASTVIHHQSASVDQIMLCVPQYERMHVPRVIVLSPTANDISTQILIESGRSLTNNASEGIGQKGAIIAPKKETKKAVENPNVSISFL